MTFDIRPPARPHTHPPPWAPAHLACPTDHLIAGTAAPPHAQPPLAASTPATAACAPNRLSPIARSPAHPTAHPPAQACKRTQKVKKLHEVLEYCLSF